MLLPTMTAGLSYTTAQLRPLSLLQPGLMLQGGVRTAPFGQSPVPW